MSEYNEGDFHWVKKHEFSDWTIARMIVHESRYDTNEGGSFNQWIGLGWDTLTEQRSLFEIDPTPIKRTNNDAT